MTEKLIQELEVKVAFLEDSLHKLSDEFYIQQRELEELKTKCAGLINKFHGLQNNEGSDIEIQDERPPHY